MGAFANTVASRMPAAAIPIPAARAATRASGQKNGSPELTPGDEAALLEEAILLASLAPDRLLALRSLADRGTDRTTPASGSALPGASLCMEADMQDEPSFSDVVLVGIGGGITLFILGVGVGVLVGC